MLTVIALIPLQDSCVSAPKFSAVNQNPIQPSKILKNLCIMSVISHQLVGHINTQDRRQHGAN